MSATERQAIKTQLGELRESIFSELRKAYWPFNHILVFIAKRYLNERH